MSIEEAIKEEMTQQFKVIDIQKTLEKGKLTVHEIDDIFEVTTNFVSQVQ